MGIFTNLPLWARGVLVVLSLGLLVGMILMVPTLSPKVLFVIGGGIVGVILLLLTYSLILRTLEKRKSGVLSLALGKHNASGSSVSDAAQRAKLDDFRRTFEDGVQKFKNAGKDLYSLPWYVVVGEPGSGKSEAIRHSNIGFPPGLQDLLQGTGGTINMNWWFTNQAVFLDTAGRLLFEEIAPGSVNEWQEFLRLLRKTRPNCPINGLVLCIPSDTLIKDSPEALQAKARKLASQLNDIQRALDVRFPVFVLVTKSDLVPGFREFFEGIHDPQLQHQMVGWSNPRSLDEPFKPEELEQLLDSYLSELYRRRLGLIEDPNPVQIGGRRINEVDTCFTYPSSLQSLFPRLKRYLETIFAAGEWAQKPLFLRGIYFTSSLQEGSALDEELARALDLPLEALPEGRVWEKEKAYFLRDVCREKVFKESRLVTRASNAKKQLRQRQMILFWTGVACLVGLAAFAYYGAESLRNSVGGQLEYWTFLEEEMEQEDSFVPAAVYEGREAGTYINNTTGSIELERKLTTVEQFHATLRELAAEEVEVPTLFKFLFLSGADRESRLQAQRVAFERYVVEPLLGFSREKLMRLEPTDWDETATEALLTLLRLEKKIADGERGIPQDPLESFRFVNPLMEFLTGEPGGTVLPEVLEATYFSEDMRGEEAEWPPPWTTGGSRLRENEALSAGLQTYLEAVQREERERLEGLKRIEGAFRTFEELRAVEGKLLEELTQLEDRNDLEDVLARYEYYLKRKNEVDREVEVLSEIFSVRSRDDFSLKQLYEAGVESALDNMDAAVTRLARAFYNGEAEFFETGGEGVPGYESYPLFGETLQILERGQNRFSRVVTAGLSEPELEQLRQFDNDYLDPVGLREEYSYRVRARIYDRVLVKLEQELGRPEVRLGGLEKALDPLLALIDGVLDDIEDYDGGRGIGFREGATQALAYYSERTFSEFGERFRDHAAEEVRGALGYPLIRGKEDGVLAVSDILGLRGMLAAYQEDLEAEAFKALPEAERDELLELQATFEQLEALTELFVTEAGNSRRATFTFQSEPQQRELLKKFYPEESFNAIFGGRNFRDLSFGGRERIRAYQAENVELAQLSLDTNYFSMEFFELADSEAPEAVLAFEGDWSPLDFLRENRSLRAEPKLGDNFELGELWNVLLPLPATGEKPLVVVLSVKYSRALPKLEDWPRLSDFNF